MARSRSFTDAAGFTRHCWECTHAKGWRKGMCYADIAKCELTGRAVEKYSSPNNQCSHIGIECRYETRRADG